LGVYYTVAGRQSKALKEDSMKLSLLVLFAMVVSGCMVVPVRPGYVVQRQISIVPTSPPAVTTQRPRCQNPQQEAYWINGQWQCYYPLQGGEYVPQPAIPVQPCGSIYGCAGPWHSSPLNYYPGPSWGLYFRFGGGHHGRGHYRRW